MDLWLQLCNFEVNEFNSDRSRRGGGKSAIHILIGATGIKKTISSIHILLHPPLNQNVISSRGTTESRRGDKERKEIRIDVLFLYLLSYRTCSRIQINNPMHKRVGSFEALVLWMKWIQLLEDERPYKCKENFTFYISFSSGQELSECGVKGNANSGPGWSQFALIRRKAPIDLLCSFHGNSFLGEVEMALADDSEMAWCCYCFLIWKKKKKEKRGENSLKGKWAD